MEYVISVGDASHTLFAMFGGGEGVEAELLLQELNCRPPDLIMDGLGRPVGINDCHGRAYSGLG